MADTPQPTVRISSAFELIQLIEKGVIDVAEARQLLLGTEASPFPAGKRQQEDPIELLRRALDAIGGYRR